MAPKVPHTLLFGDRPLVAFDTETTGLWAPTNRLVEIGAVKFRLGEEGGETFQSLINPLRVIPDDATRVHGITNEMVADAPPAAPVLEQFTQFIGDSILVAHNAPFDISFLGCELDRASLPLPPNEVLDTVDIFHRLYPGFPSYSLLSLISIFGVAQSQEHRALSDACHVRSLCELMAERVADFEDPLKVMSTFDVHAITRWLPRDVELPAEFTDITVAIRNQLRLEIVYYKDGAGAQTRVIRPRHVLSRKAQYYVVAYCETAQADRTFRLDRILSFSLAK